MLIYFSVEVRLVAKQASKSNAHCDSWPGLTVTARTSLWKWICKQLLLPLVLLYWPICNIDRLWNVRFSSAFFCKFFPAVNDFLWGCSCISALNASPWTCHESSLCDERRTKAKRNINSLGNMKFNVCSLLD